MFAFGRLVGEELVREERVRWKSCGYHGLHWVVAIDIGSCWGEGCVHKGAYHDVKSRLRLAKTKHVDFTYGTTELREVQGEWL